MCKIKNAKTVAWSEEETTKPDYISRGHETFGGEGQSSGSKQERNNRACCPSTILITGTSITGGMLDNLMEEYSNQVVIKKALILETEAEIKQLEDKIKEFQLLKNELEKESKSE